MNWIGPSHVRTSTLILAAVIVVVGIVRRRPLVGVLAMLAWVAGYEATWQTTAMLMHSRGAFVPWTGWYLMATVLVGLAIVVRASISWPWVTITAALWGLWIATGWHYNIYTDPSLDWSAELLNVATKTAWGMCYLWPLLRRTTKAHRRWVWHHPSFPLPVVLLPLHALASYRLGGGVLYR